MKRFIKRNSQKRITSVVFVFFFLVMLSSNGGHLDVWDGKGYFLLAQNIARHHSLVLESNLLIPDDGNGRFSLRNYFAWLHSIKGEQLPVNATLQPTAGIGSPLFALIGVPFYVAADAIGYSTVKFTSYFVNSLIVSLLCVVVFAFASEFYRSRRIGFVVAIIVSVGSFIWPYVTGYFEQPLAALISISSLYFLFIASRNVDTQNEKIEVRNMSDTIVRLSPLFAGALLGIQTFGHPGTAVIVPGIAIIGIYIFRRDKKKLLQFLLAFVFLVAIQGLVNLLLHGSITDFGFGRQQTLLHHSGTEGLYGLIMSPGLGLATYFPVIVFLPLAIYFVWNRNKIFCIAFIYIFFSIWLFAGTLPGHYWTGAGAWGPRYMIPTVPALALMMGSVVSGLWPSNHNIRFVDRLNSHSPGTAKLQTGSVLEPPRSFDSKLKRLLQKIIKILFIILIFSGFLINLLGVLVWYQSAFAYSWQKLHWNKLPGDSQNYALWDPKYNPLLLHWYALNTGWSEELRSVYPIYHGWSPCIPDNFLYCNFGFVPVVILLIVTAAVGTVAANSIILNSRKH